MSITQGTFSGNPLLAAKALLREATNEQARAKIGAFGFQGSSKTTTLALLAIGLSKSYHNNAPVAMHDTENGSDFLRPIFAMEGVKLLVHKSRAFSDMIGTLAEAEQRGCCAMIEDSITHTWKDLTDSYAAAKARQYKLSEYRLQLSDWGPIKAEWGRWTARYLNSPLHCLIAGRAGYEWDFEENDQTHKKELQRGATKMKTEGEFGFEPNLLIEMEAQREGQDARGRGGHYVYLAHVLKDRSRKLNGQELVLPDVNNYEPGDWQKVFALFRPHFEFLNLGGTQRALESSTSEAMFGTDGDSDYARRSRQKQIALDEAVATMQLLWPGQAVADKALRIRVLETLWGTRAWSAVEAMPLERVSDGLEALREYEKRAKDAGGTETEAGVLKLLETAKGREASAALSAPSIQAVLPGSIHAPINLPPIPPKPAEIEEEDPEIAYEQSGELLILRGATFRIKDSIKGTLDGRYLKQNRCWTIPVKYFNALAEICEKLGIALVQ